MVSSRVADARCKVASLAFGVLDLLVVAKTKWRL